MNIEVHQASLEDKTILRNLMELYAYDFSEFDHCDVDAHGLFGYNRLDHYWQGCFMLQKSTCTTEIIAAVRPPGGLPTLFSGIVAGFRGPNTRLHYGCQHNHVRITSQTAT